MGIRKLFPKEKLIGALKSLRALRSLRFTVPHALIVEISALSSILFLAFTVRVLPIRWGFYLSEFDPYFQYRLTRHMVENGFFSWLNWHDFMSWYPYGRDIALTSFPGLPLTAAFSYSILQVLGVPLTLYEFCVVFPPIMGMVTCLVMYFLGKDVGGREAGLFSSLFLALNSSYILRTQLGFFDDETVGIFGVVLFCYLFLRSIDEERTKRSGLLYAVFAGLSLGYICASWGAARYLLAVTPLFIFVLFMLRRYSTRLLVAYGIVSAITLLVSVSVPRLGFKFLLEPVSLAMIGLLGLLCLMEAFQRTKTTRSKLLVVALSIAVFAVAAFMLRGVGVAMEAKFWGAINPLGRSPLVESVAEHRPSSWSALYYDLGIGVFFVIIGFFFAVQRPSNRNVFFALFGLTALYFASSMVRLTVLSAPAFSVLLALGLVNVVKPFITVMKEAPTIHVGRMRLGTHVGKEFSGAFLIFMFFLLTFTFVLPLPGQPFSRVFVQADSPVTIASAGMPIKPEETVTDWLYALAWMRVNLPPTAVVASWWDYGYWITIVANKTTIADNATINSTQIRRIAEMFLSNETEAVKILKQYGVTHVVVFITFDTSGNDIGWGEENKWRWMARIAGLNETDFGNYDQSRRWVWNERGLETTIFKMMNFGKGVRMGVPSGVSLDNFRLVYYSKGPSQGGVNALVCVYEVIYEK